MGAGETPSVKSKCRPPQVLVFITCDLERLRPKLRTGYLALEREAMPGPLKRAMEDAVLWRNDQAEQLSRAYVQVLAAGAGYTTSTPSLDRDSVDLEIHAGGPRRPKLDLQLKATTDLGPEIENAYRFSLKIKNYNDLRVETLVPRILVVLVLPKSEDKWLTVTAEELILRRCAYWRSLAGAPETMNRNSVAVSVPVGNRFDIHALRSLLDRARTGAL